MQFLSLSAAQFFIAFGLLGGFTAALYLLDRTKRIQIVPTLRFWNSVAAPVSRRRTRLREPFSLLLQLLALLLLLMAIAEIRWGGTWAGSRNCVLLIDTSASAAERRGGSLLLEQEKRLLRRYLDGLPEQDRVLLVRADELVTPLASFTADRNEVRKRLDEARPSSLSLNLARAVRFADQSRTAAAGRPGEIAYAGALRIAEGSAPVDVPGGLRILPVDDSDDNSGITGLTVQAQQGSSMLASVKVRNYSSAVRTVKVAAYLGDAEAGHKDLSLKAGETGAAEFPIDGKDGERLQMRLEGSRDGFSGDDSAELTLPSGRPRVVAVTKRPELMGAIFGADHDIDFRCIAVSAYRSAGSSDVLIFDQFVPPVRPDTPSLWIDPPRANSPLPIVRSLKNGSVVSGSVIIPGHARLAVMNTNVFSAHAGDITLATTAEGPAAIVRQEGQDGERFAVVGFDPGEGAARFQVLTPIVLRSALRWLSARSRSGGSVSVQPAGLVGTPLEAAETAANVSVHGDGGEDLPFSVRDGTLTLFAERPSTVTLQTPQRRLKIEATLPNFPPFRWSVPGGIPQGLPSIGERVAYLNPWRIYASLAALILLLEWWRYSRNRGLLLVLKIAGMCVIGAALCAPVLRLPSTRRAAIVLLDASSSISSQSLRLSALRLREWSGQSTVTRLIIAPFAHAAHVLRRAEDASEAALRSATGDIGRTNIEAALEYGLAVLPPGFDSRLVLMSDGNENEGEAVRAGAELRRAGVPVDTVPLGGESGDGFRILSVSVPPRAHAGESIAVSLRVSSPRDVRVEIDLSAQGVELGKDTVLCRGGVTTVQVRTRINASGATLISGTVSGDGLGPAKFEGLMVLEDSTALYVSQDPPAEDQNLLDVLRKSGFRILRNQPIGDSALAGVELVVLNNLDLDALPSNQKTALENYVEKGGGVLVLSGEHEAFRERKQPTDPLDRLLPASLAPPEMPEGICVVLVIDKSSSMEGRKIELARLSASSVVDHLRPVDSIGVLIFDNTHEWAVPLRRAADKASIKRLIAGIVPDGGTQIPPALEEAYRRIVKSKATYKHIVLLTDGISEEGDSLQLAKEALFHQVTISTVGLGQDVNKSYLQRMASASGGSSYLLNDPQELQQLLVKDVEEFTGKTAVEKPFVPIAEMQANVLEGVSLDHAPVLKGYVRLKKKPGSETILGIDPQRHDPLLVRWQYGLGRVAVFASDAKSRWAEDWITWKGFDPFWSNIARDLSGVYERGETRATIDQDSEEIRVNYHSGEADPAALSSIPAFVFGPKGFRSSMAMSRISPNDFEGHLVIPRRPGLWIVRPAIHQEHLPEAGVIVPDVESADVGVNEKLLRNLSQATGGRFNPPPSSSFNGEGRRTYERVRVWPLLLALAIALTVAELCARKLVAHRRSSPEAGMARRAA